MVRLRLTGKHLKRPVEDTEASGFSSKKPKPAPAVPADSTGKVAGRPTRRIAPPLVHAGTTGLVAGTAATLASNVITTQAQTSGEIKGRTTRRQAKIKEAKEAKKAAVAQTNRTTSHTRKASASGSGDYNNDDDSDDDGKAIREDGDEDPEDFYLKKKEFKFDFPEIISKYLEVKQGKYGRGIYTRVPDIPAGTLLFQERALLQDIPYDPESKLSNTKKEAKFRKDVRTAVAHLSKPNKRKFVALTWNGLSNNEEDRMNRNLGKMFVLLSPT